MCKVVEDKRNESLQEGIKAGRKEEKLAVAKRMLADGSLTLEQIAALSGLPLDEVKKLQAGKGDSD